MDLHTFVILANDEERNFLCDESETTFKYIRKLSYVGNTCSPYKAYLIEQATTKLASNNKKLGIVRGQSLVKNQDKYKSFIKNIRSREDRGELRP